jgi:hypothetical protein
LSFSEPGWLNKLGSWITYQLTNTEWVRKLQKRAFLYLLESNKQWIQAYEICRNKGMTLTPINSIRLPTGTPASFTTKTGRHDIAEILLKVVVKHQKSKSNQIFFIYTHKSQLAQRILQFNTLQFGIVLEKFNRRWRDDNTMTKRKGRKDQTMIYKTLHRKLKIEKHEPH